MSVRSRCPMQVRPLTHSLDEFANDLVFHGTRVVSNKLAAMLDAVVQGAIVGVDKCRADETMHERTIVLADALAAGARAEAELFCIEFGKFLLGYVKQNRKDVRWLKYFAKSPSEIVNGDREGLEKWLTGVQEATNKEQDPEIAAQTEPVVGLTASWTAAKLGQLQAAEANRQHGETVRLPMRQHINGLLEKNWLTLRQIANDQNLGKRWADSFFRKVTKPKGSGDAK